MGEEGEGFIVEFLKIVDRGFGSLKTVFSVVFQGRRSGLGDQACISKSSASKPLLSWAPKAPLSPGAGPRLSFFVFTPPTRRALGGSISSDP